MKKQVFALLMAALLLLTACSAPAPAQTAAAEPTQAPVEPAAPTEVPAPEPMDNRLIFLYCRYSLQSRGSLCLIFLRDTLSILFSPCCTELRL